MSVIEDLIAENDADQIAKSKLVFVEDVEEQIAPTKKTRAKKVVQPIVEDESEDLPDTIENYLYIKDLPESVKKLAIHRSKEQDMTTDFDDLQDDDTLKSILLWNNTPEGKDFWKGIHEKGDLREFKRLYGNKGEKVDELIEIAELNEFVEGLANPISSKQLPNTIKKNPKIKDLPEPVKKLTLFRQKEQGRPYNLSDDIDSFIWRDTPEGTDFWNNIEDGDLTEFKRIYGDEGEKVDAIINSALTVKTRKARTPKAKPAPAVITQNVEVVELVVYPPEGGVVNIKTESLYEFHDTSRFILSRFKMKNMYFSCNVITNYQTLTSKLSLNIDDSQDEFLSKLKQNFDKLAYLNWKNFDEKQGDADKIILNEEIINDAFEIKVQKTSFFAPPPKPVKVVTPKPVKVVAPKVVAPKPIKVVAPKAQKVVKPKVTKPKVEDDLSFLNDLNNIF